MDFTAQQFDEIQRVNENLTKLHAAALRAFRCADGTVSIAPSRAIDYVSDRISSLANDLDYLTRVAKRVTEGKAPRPEREDWEQQALELEAAHG